MVRPALQERAVVLGLQGNPDLLVRVGSQVAVEHPVNLVRPESQEVAAYQAVAGRLVLTEPMAHLEHPAWRAVQVLRASLDLPEAAGCPGVVGPVEHRESPGHLA